MSDGNGRIPIIGGHRPAMKKDSDLITVREARALVAEEATKVHEYYLNQIPQFVARMIQDALVSYGLITLSEEAQLAATQSAVADARGSDPATDVAAPSHHQASDGPSVEPLLADPPVSERAENPLAPPPGDATA